MTRCDIKLEELTHVDLCRVLEKHLNHHVRQSRSDDTEEVVMNLLIAGYRSFVGRYGLVPAMETDGSRVQSQVAVVKDGRGRFEVLMPERIIFIPAPGRVVN